MAVFLAKPAFTHALLLDSDISFQPNLFIKLIDFDADFIAGPCPQRRAKITHHGDLAYPCDYRFAGTP